MGFCTGSYSADEEQKWKWKNYMIVMFTSTLNGAGARYVFLAVLIWFAGFRPENDESNKLKNK
jgi:hypothetical protein